MIFLKKIFVVIFIIPLTCSCQHGISKAEKDKSFDLVKQSEIFLKTNNLDSAEKLISESIKIYPDNYIAYNDRAYLKYKQNKSQQEIINDYKKALEIWPEYDIGLYSITNYYFSIKDYKNTIEMSARYLSLQLSKNLDSDMLADIYSKTGESEQQLLEFDHAIIDLQKSIQLNPNIKESHKQLAECYYYGRNDIQSAILEFTKALDIDSTYYQAYYGREHCYKNSKPPLLMQAASDSINAEKFDTRHKSKSDTIYSTFEKIRKSLNIKTSQAAAFYDSIIFLFRPNKILQQNVVDNIVLNMRAIKNDSSAIIDTKYLQTIINDAAVSNELLLLKLSKIREVDSAINCKKKLLDYETLFGSLMADKMPELLKILNQPSEDRFTKVKILLEPIFILIKQKGDEFKDAEEALMDKYSLH